MQTLDLLRESKYNLINLLRYIRPAWNCSYTNRADQCDLSPSVMSQSSESRPLYRTHCTSRISSISFRKAGKKYGVLLLQNTERDGTSYCSSCGKFIGSISPASPSVHTGNTASSLGNIYLLPFTRSWFSLTGRVVISLKRSLVREVWEQVGQQLISAWIVRRL